MVSRIQLRQIMNASDGKIQIKHSPNKRDGGIDSCILVASPSRLAETRLSGIDGRFEVAQSRKPGQTDMWSNSESRVLKVQGGASPRANVMKLASQIKPDSLLFPQGYVLHPDCPENMNVAELLGSKRS